MNGNFKIGQEVKVVKNTYHHHFSIGTIVKLESYDNPFQVFKAKYLNGHDFWYVKSEDIEEIKENQTIIIYPKGNEVIATIKEGKKVVKSAKATCNPSDIFDFEVGAKLAFERLFGEEVKNVISESIVKKVKRPAKVGEWIEATKDWMEVKTGNILMVMKVNSYGVAGVEVNGKRVSGGDYFNLCINEYVVLENYTPEAKPEPFRKAKVGDKIKIVKVKDGMHSCSHAKNGDTFTIDLVDNDGVHDCDKGYFWDKYEEYIIIEESKPVNRVSRKAEIGEYVEVIKARNTYGNYKNGDILQIIPTEFTRPHYKDNYGCYLEESEYIVLENYKEATK